MRHALWIICLAAAFTAQPAAAEGPPSPRGLKIIDFEERQLGNNEDLPMHWVKISGAGLPHYVNGYLSNDRSHGGQYSFRFDLNGGSLVYRYEPMQIPVLVGARYHIECYCQTSVMPSARARLTAYFTDQDGHPLGDLVRQTPLYAATHDNEGWKKLSVELNADNPKAAYLAVELGLLQPELYAARSLGARTILPQDIHGSAWFDDVSIAQIPQVSLQTDRPGNIFRLGEPTRMSVIVNDPFSDDLQSRLLLTDATGATVYQRSGAVDQAGMQILGPGRRRLNVALPKLAAGWYRAEIEMSSQGHELGKQSADIIQLADPAEPSPPDPRFGVIATDLKPAETGDLPSLLPLLSAGRVKLGVWNDDQDLTETDAATFDSLLETLETKGIAPTGCLIGLPPAVAASVGGTSWLKLLQAQSDTWQPQLAYLISRHAEHLDRWQLGADYSDDFAADPRMRQVYDLVYKQFSQLMRAPDLAMPLPAWFDLGNNSPATGGAPAITSVALSIPPQVLPERIPLYLRDMQNAAAPKRQVSISLEWLDGKYGRPARLRDLARRFIYALAGGATRIDLPLPLEIQTQGDQTLTEPREEFIIDRTLMRILGGATFKGTTILADGVEALLFDKESQAILAVWTKGSRATQSIDVDLGSEVFKVDLWGNVTPLTKVNSTGNQTRVDAGPMPFFLIGIDGVAARIRTSIAFDQPLIESSFQSHVRHLKFANPTGEALSGSIRLRPPPGWTITPASFQFTLNAGQDFDRQLAIEFPYNSIAGAKTVTAEFSLNGEGAVDFAVPLPLTLGLSDVGMQTSALRDGNDLLVQEAVTNYSESPIDYTAYAAYPGLTRQERLVQSLAPGRTTIKLYRFKNVKWVAGAKVRCGLRQLEGTRVLNDDVAIQ